MKKEMNKKLIKKNNKGVEALVVTHKDKTEWTDKAIEDYFIPLGMQVDFDLKKSVGKDFTAFWFVDENPINLVMSVYKT